MCGIVGFTGKTKDNKKIIKAMADKINHRGPDGEGYFVEEEIALGHKRLSIIDLKGGSQPMFSADKKLVIVFNGEIYNYKDLKEELKEYKFKTNSDTEVILNGYLKWGKDMPKHLRGMFAFALYDIENKELFCARDYFGIKPFYYYENNGIFMFASEIKALLEHPDFVKEMDESVISSYLIFGFNPKEESFFKGVKELKPGNYLIYKDGKKTIKPFFEIDFKTKNETYEKAVEEVESVMKESVDYHMVSDVEVGSFLSSGIDSSYIVSLARPDKTYTVGYENKKYSEIDYAKDLAGKLNITNKSKLISKEEYFKALNDAIYHMDEPTEDPAVCALYFVAQLASKDVKVVLSGEGADELFAGYNYYREEVDYQFYNKIPYFLRHIASKFFSLFPSIRGINFIVRRGEKVENAYVGVSPVWGKHEINKVLKKHEKFKPSDITGKFLKNFMDRDNLTKMQVIDLNCWLVKDILKKGDRMTMAHSIEARVPFVDKEVFKVASSLKTSYKVNKTNTKVALREAAKSVIPTEAYKKKKLGFPVPIREWMKEDDVYSDIENKLSNETAEKYFNTKYLKKLLSDHKTGKKDNYRKIWSVYIFLKWHELFFES